MKRTTGAMVLLAAVSGCMSTEPAGTGTGQYMSRAFDHGSVGCLSGQAMCRAVRAGLPGAIRPAGGHGRPLHRGAAWRGRHGPRHGAPERAAGDGAAGAAGRLQPGRRVRRHAGAVLRPRPQLPARHDAARPRRTQRSRNVRRQPVRARHGRARRRGRRRRPDRRPQPVPGAAHPGALHRPQRNAHRLVRPDARRPARLRDAVPGSAWPLQLPPGRHLPAQAERRPEPAGRRAVPDDGGRAGQRQDRRVPGPQPRAGDVHRGGLQPGGRGQLSWSR